MAQSIEEIESVLSDLRIILNDESERNWSRSIDSILLLVQSGTEEDFVAAKSMYKTMCSGGAGFMGFYIKRDSFKEQLEINTRLDNARDRLWNALVIETI